MKKYLKLMRVKHYIKNVLIFLPIIFAGKFFDVESLIKAVIGFFAFSLIASVVYIINDIHDLDCDRNHEIKMHRPLASGEVSLKQAYFLLLLLLAGAILISVFVIPVPRASVLLFVYLLINLGYSFGLKDIPLVDISVIVAGFILRVAYGGAVIEVKISSWMFLTVMAMSFILLWGKEETRSRKTDALHGRY